MISRNSIWKFVCEMHSFFLQCRCLSWLLSTNILDFWRVASFGGVISVVLEIWRLLSEPSETISGNLISRSRGNRTCFFWKHNMTQIKEKSIRVLSRLRKIVVYKSDSIWISKLSLGWQKLCTWFWVSRMGDQPVPLPSLYLHWRIQISRARGGVRDERIL